MTLDQSTTPALLHAALPGADGGKPAAWVHLIPAGIFRGADGRGPYALNDPAGVVAAMRAELPLPIDEMHATDLGGSSLGMAAPARGWIVEMQARADGIWGRVEWTQAGAELLTDRAYRGISPVLLTRSKGGEVTGLLRASLTNVPNLPLTTLHAEGAAMDFLTTLRQLLGLKEDADENAIIVALNAVMTDRTLAQQDPQAQAAPTLTKADETMIRTMGIDRDAFIKTRAAEGRAMTFGRRG